MDTRIERLEAIRDELFDIANSYAGNQTGTAAAEIHRAVNQLGNVLRMLNTGITEEDRKKNIIKWLSDNPTLLEVLTQSHK